MHLTSFYLIVVVDQGL